MRLALGVGTTFGDGLADVPRPISNQCLALGIGAVFGHGGADVGVFIVNEVANDHLSSGDHVCLALRGFHVPQNCPGVPARGFFMACIRLHLPGARQRR